MADMKKLLHTFDEADELLNGKIERTNLSTIVASATASVENKKTVSIRGTGRNIESLKVGGRTVQDGTPTPDAPVEVLGVGDKTVNIFDKHSEFVSGKSVDDDGNVIQSDGFGYYSMASIVKPNCTYTVSGKITSNNTYGRIYFYDKSHTFISRSDGFEQTKIPYTFVTPDNAYYIGLQVRIESYDSDSIQIQEGSVDTPYEPYGKYKIPVSCNGEITNIYLDNPVFEGETVDFANGIVNRKYKVIDANAIDWTKNTGSHYWKCVDSDIAVPQSSSTKPDAYSNKYVAIDDSSVTASKPQFVITENGLFVSDLGSSINTPKDCYFICLRKTPIEETFNTSPIPTASGNNELAINTEVTPGSIDITSFGDYYSKAEVNNIFNNLNSRIKFLEEHAIVGSGTITVPGMTGSPNTNSE